MYARLAALLLCGCLAHAANVCNAVAEAPHLEKFFLQRGTRLGLWELDLPAARSFRLPGSMKLWSLNVPNTAPQDFKGKCDDPGSAAFSPNGKLILASCNSGLKLLDWRNQFQLPPPKLSSKAASVTISPAGKSFAAADANDIAMWRTPNSVFRLKGHIQPVTSLVFSPDGSRLASGGYDASVKLFELLRTPQVSLHRIARIPKGELIYVAKNNF